MTNPLSKRQRGFAIATVLETLLRLGDNESRALARSLYLHLDKHDLDATANMPSDTPELDAFLDEIDGEER